MEDGLQQSAHGYNDGNCAWLFP